MKHILAAAACMLTICQFTVGQIPKASGRSAANDAARQKLKELDSRLDEAFTRGDRRIIEKHLAGEMISFNSEGDVVARRAEILNQINPPPPGVKLSISASDVQVFLFGSTAIVASRKTFKNETSSGSSADRYRETNTYAFRNGIWQLVSSQTFHGPPEYSAKDVRMDLKLGNFVKGNEDATVVLIEFIDYQCPICRKFAAETMKQIESDYIKPGRIGFTARNHPVEEAHPLALGAATAVECAGAEGKFWEMYESLLTGPMALAPSDLAEHARKLGLDSAKFQQCLDDGKVAAGIREEMLIATKLGIIGTPIFLVGVRKPKDNEVKVVRMIQGGYPMRFSRPPWIQ